MTKTVYLTILGSEGVGKSAFAAQWQYCEWYDKWDPTVADSFSKTITLDGVEVKVELYDTICDYSGDFSDERMWKAPYLLAESFIIMFDITNIDSFKNVQSFCDNIQKIKQVSSLDQYPTVLIGNKMDLEKDRKISIAQAQSLAKDLSISYFEVSAKTRQNVEEIINGIVAKQLSPQNTKNCQIQ